MIQKIILLFILFDAYGTVEAIKNSQWLEAGFMGLLFLFGAGIILILKYEHGEFD